MALYTDFVENCYISHLEPLLIVAKDASNSKGVFVRNFDFCMEISYLQLIVHTLTIARCGRRFLIASRDASGYTNIEILNQFGKTV